MVVLEKMPEVKRQLEHAHWTRISKHVTLRFRMEWAAAAAAEAGFQRLHHHHQTGSGSRKIQIRIQSLERRRILARVPSRYLESAKQRRENQSQKMNLTAGSALEGRDLAHRPAGNSVVQA